MNPIRVAIVEDNRAMREGLSELIRRTPGFLLVATCANGNVALSEIPLARPDVTIMDINMPIMDGVESVLNLKKRGFQGHFLMLTVATDSSNILRALEAGARGYLVKDSEPEKIIKSIRKLHDGAFVLSSPIAEVLITNIQQRGVANSRTRAKGVYGASVAPAPRAGDFLPYVIGGLLHDARNTLVALRDKAGRLARYSESSSKERLDKGITFVSEQISNLDRVIGTVHQIVHEQYDSAAHNSGYVSGRISDFIADLQGRWPNVAITVLIDPGFDMNRLPVGVSLFIIRELLQNAAKAACKGNLPSIELEIIVAPNKSVCIMCSNSHGSFPTDMISRIDRKDLRNSASGDMPGNGLFFISEIAKRLNGDLRAENQSPIGAVVQVWLPLTNPTP